MRNDDHLGAGVVSGVPVNQSMQVEQSAVPDRRSILRRRVLKGVKIAFGEDFCAVEGVMRNISDTGALIKVRDGLLVPDTITVHNELDGYKIAAEVVRRRSDHLGVRFTGEKQPIGRSRAQVVSMLDDGVEASEEGSNSESNADEFSDIRPAPRQKPVFGKLGTLKR